METTIQTRSYEDALRWALDKGFTLASVFGVTSEIREMLEAAQAEADEDREGEESGWIVIGDVLCRASDIWEGTEKSTRSPETGTARPHQKE